MLAFKTLQNVYQEIKFGVFPNQETYADLALPTTRVEILFKFENDGDFIKLKFLKDYLDENHLPAPF